MTKAKKDKTIRVVIISGIFTIIVAIIYVFGRQFYNHEFGRLKVIDVNTIKSRKKQGVEITFKNLSDNLETLNSIKIIFAPTYAQSTKLKGTIGTTTYTIDDKLNFSADSNSTISYKVTGKLYFPTSGQWSMNFEFPVQEELATQESRNVDIFLPKIMEVTRESTSQIDRKPAKDSLNLLKFLSSQEGVIVTVYGSGSVNVDQFMKLVTF